MGTPNIQASPPSRPSTVVLDEPVIAPPEPEPEPERSVLLTTVDTVISFPMHLPGLAVKLAAASPFAQSIKDEGIKFTESSDRRIQRRVIANTFETKVKDRVFDRLDVLQNQLTGEYLKVLSPYSKPDRDELRGAIKTAQTLQGKLLNTHIGMGAKFAADAIPMGLGWAFNTGEAVAGAMGLTENKSLVDLEQERGQLAAEYRALVHKYPALGAVDLSEVDDNTSDDALQSLLRSGFAEKQTELSDLRHRVLTGDVPVLQLEHIVNATKAEMGISKERAAAGDTDSELLLEHLAFESHKQDSIDLVLFAGTVGLSLAAVLATGPLGLGALGAAGLGATVGIASAAYNIELADDIRDSARVGLEDNSGMTDRDAADLRFGLAAAEGVMAVADVGMLVKGAVQGVKAARQGARAAANFVRQEAVTEVTHQAVKNAPAPQSVHRAYVPNAETAPTLPTGRQVTPREPTTKIPVVKLGSKSRAGFIDDAPIGPSAKRMDTVTLPAVPAQASKARPSPAKPRPAPVQPEPAPLKAAPSPKPGNAETATPKPNQSEAPYGDPNATLVPDGPLRDPRDRNAFIVDMDGGGEFTVDMLKQLRRHDAPAAKVMQATMSEPQLSLLAQTLEPAQFSLLARDPHLLDKVAEAPVGVLKNALANWSSRDVPTLAIPDFGLGPVTPQSLALKRLEADLDRQSYRVAHFFPKIIRG